MSARPDVVVVGGGVVGLSVAYELARRGALPLVLDRGDSRGGASRAAAGMLAPVSEAELEEPPMIELGLDSLARYPAFVRDVEADGGGSCRFLPDGTLWAALDRDEGEQLRHVERILERKGLSARRLAPAEVLEREPHLSGRVVAGLLAEHDLQVDPRELCAALARAIARRGGAVRGGSEVVAIASVAGTLRLTLSGTPDPIVAPVVVLAAGAWSSEGIALPFDGLRVRPVKGQLVRLRGERLLRHVVRNPECYIVPRADGELLIGATVEEQGFDLAPTAGALHDLLRHAWRLLPGIYDLEIAEISVGLRPALEDHLPAIGPTFVPGLYLACGHFRSGVLLAPATAQLLAEAIATGSSPAALDPFLPQRLGLREPDPARRER